MPDQIKNEMWQEPDWEFIDFAWKLEKEWRESLRHALPKTDNQWLEIFPEAKEIIREKISEWEEKAEAARMLVSKAMRIIYEKSNQENRWFWVEVLRYTFSPARDLMEAKRHIRRLKWTMPKKKRKGRNWNIALEKARSADIVYLVESYRLSLKRSGQRFFAICPKHDEKTASFCLFPPSRFYCFGCNTKGDQISFVQIMEDCSFSEAVWKLQTAT